jgi:hypothetical protein
MKTKLEKNDKLKIQLKKVWIPFIFIILGLINISLIPQLLKNPQNLIKNNIKYKLKDYEEKEKTDDSPRANIFHVKNHQSKKEIKARERIKVKTERNNYIQTFVYIFVLLSLVLLFIIFIAKANMQSNIPIQTSSDPRIEGYINLPESTEIYKPLNQIC